MKPPVECAAPKAGGRRRVCKDDGGFALTWFAIFLLVLVAMAGFGVDVWNWWYTSQKVQRAADAAALAGVTFLPSNFDTPATGPNAITTAQAAAKQNGFVDGGKQHVKVTPGSKSNQLDVSVSQTVDNIFTSLLGAHTTTISRKATAEFNAPIQMGSPAGHLGNDPENGATDKHWLNIGAPGVNKQTGDRYADYANCGDSYQCNNSINSEFYDGTYVFTVDVPASAAGTDVDIQAYDPEYAAGNTTCNNNPLSTTQITALQATYPDAATRYAGVQNDYCTGDDDTHTLTPWTPQATAWIVRDSSVSQFQALSNPVVASGGPNGACAHQFKGYVPNSAASPSTYWYDLLNPGGANYDSDFAKSFHRWYTLCHIPAATAGKYFIQVRSSVPLSLGQRDDPTYLTKSESTPEDPSIAGQNRYSLRVVNHNTSTVASGIETYAETHLPIYTNTTGVNTPNFYLARLLPGGGSTGRKLHLVFYDIGDIFGGTTSVIVSPPVDMTGSAPTCSWTANGPGDESGMPSGGTVSGCTVSGITSNDYGGGGFNGVLVIADISVSGNYSCDAESATGCWFKIQMSYTGGGATQANDTTTWDASIAGDPVRLVK
jgi:Flp pilus assembly protein TadG